MKRWTLPVLLIAVALFGCCVALHGQESALWPGKDDMTIVYYPGAIVDNPVVNSIVKTNEWKEFFKKACKKIDQECQKAMKSSDTTTKLDSWVRAQVKKYQESDVAVVGDIFNGGIQHAQAFALCVNFDMKKNWGDDRVNGIVIAILDTDPAKSNDLKSFLKEKVDYKVVPRKDGLSLIKVTLAKDTVFAGKAKLGKSNKFAIVVARDEAEVVSRCQLLAKADGLATLIDKNKSLLKSISINKQLIDKFTPELTKFVAQGKKIANEKLPKMEGSDSFFKSFLPGTNPVGMLRNIFQKVDSVVYTAEQKGKTGMVFGLQINTVNSEDAQEVNDVVVGAVALFKMQTKSKAAD
ncbi:MAG: hypothetical protein PHQ75_15675, partial [Thermoguttaceae bacterium]|nr:hypothetical protein [Thermoguttaceae bacterium]